MIRLYEAICKAYFNELTERQMFQKATDSFSHLKEACPKCGAKGKLSEHGDYGRYLVSFEEGEITVSLVSPDRFYCSSCGTSHALLPDIIIPYGRYSLLFVLAVLIAYFERAVTVANICEKFGIAVSTIYDWKERIALHKELMLGALINQKHGMHAYVLWLVGSGDLSGILRRFFRKYGFSFMQCRSESAARSRPP